MTIEAQSMNITQGKTDYALAYSALARRISMATAYLQANNISAAMTLMNECGEIMRILESPHAIYLCNPKESP